MRTYSAFTTLCGRTEAGSLAAALEKLEPSPPGISVAELDDVADIWEVGAYFANPPDDVELALLSAAHGAKAFTVSELPDIDWVSMAHRELHPITAGRYWIFGNHCEEVPPAGLVPIRIDLTMAFGTGHHATTQGCLVALDALLRDGCVPDNVADIGCGTGVLAIAAAKSGASQVIASDLDQVAIEVASVNVAANGMEGRVACVQADGLDHPAHRNHVPYGLVFANIVKSSLIDLAGPIGISVRPGGHAVLSGILNEQVPEIETAFASAGFRIEDGYTIGDWTTVVMIRG